MSFWPFSGRRVSAGSRKVTREGTVPEEETATRYVVPGLSFPKSRQLFEVIQTREIVARLPHLSGRTGHFLFSGAPLTRSFREKGASEVVVGYLAGARTGGSHTEGECRFRGTGNALPLRDQVCEWVMLSAPPLPATPLASLLKEFGRILTPRGSGGVLIDWHPYSAAVQDALRDQPALDATEGVGLERYFKALRNAGLVVVQVREAFVDGAMRKLLDNSEEKEWFEAHKREPFAIILFFQRVPS